MTQTVPAAASAEVSSGLPPSQVVCVLGMHRSGTSLVTKYAAAVGVSLGPDELLMAPHAVDNPTGYWEFDPIVAINERILEAFGGSWDDPPILREGWEHSPVLAGFRTEARHAIAELVGSGGVVGWKDPRTSFLLPFWSTVVPVTATLLVHRHPFQVAESLARRDGMDSERAAWLWSRYLIAAWRAHPNRAIVSYESALAEPEVMAVNIAGFLGLPTPEAETLELVRGFADPALNRSNGAQQDIGPRMTMALALHALLESQDFTTLDAVFGALHQEWTRSGR